jgi:hypothetical protein
VPVWTAWLTAVAGGLAGATIEGSRTACDGVGPRSCVTLVVVTRHSRLRLPATLVVRARVTVVKGVTAQAVAAAQGRALRSLLATLGAPGPAGQVDIENADGSAAQAEETG